jgi:dihydroflavonol-4-reductase
VTRALVTGATGLIGSHVCGQLAKAGVVVTALVRNPAQAAALQPLGVNLAVGDLLDPGSVTMAARDAEWVVHAAALIPGGAVCYPDPYYDEVNVTGTANVLAAAEAASRIVVMNTSGAFDRRHTISEASAEVPGPVTDPYARSKREMHRMVMSAVGAGRHIVTILPPATIGPAPSGRRAAEPPGFNSRMAASIRGEIAEFPQMPLSVALAADVAAAAVAALQRGRAGAVYLPWGRPDELVGACDLLNMACQAAGVSHRVRPLSTDDLCRPEVLERWGPSIVRSATTYPTPYFRNERTVRELGHTPTRLADAVAQTTRFLDAIGGLTPLSQDAN